MFVLQSWDGETRKTETKEQAIQEMKAMLREFMEKGDTIRTLDNKYFYVMDSNGINTDICVKIKEVAK